MSAKKGAGLNVRHIHHGLARTRVAQAWHAMIDRCEDKNRDFHEYYSDRGIGICAFLRLDPRNLLHVLGDHPGKGWTLDRINPNGNYSCGHCLECVAHDWLLNVRWATHLTQANNRRNTPSLTIEGITKSIADWAREWGISRQRIYKRMQAGQSIFPLEKRNAWFSRRKTLVTVDGITRTVSEWAHHYKVSEQRIYYLLRTGQSLSVSQRKGRPPIGEPVDRVELEA